MADNFSGTLQLLQSAIGAASLRSSVISNNIANVDTPGFKSSSVEFETLLAQQMGEGLHLKRTRDKHIDWTSAQGIAPQVIQNDDTTMRMDGNNVDIEQEMVAMARNTLYYSALVQKLNKQMGRLRLAITEGR